MITLLWDFSLLEKRLQWKHVLAVRSIDCSELLKRDVAIFSVLSANLEHLTIGTNATKTKMCFSFWLELLCLFFSTVSVRRDSWHTAEPAPSLSCGLFLNCSTLESGMRSAVLNLSCSLWRTIQHWNEICHWPPQVKPMLCFGPCMTSFSPSKLLLQLFIFSIIAQLPAIQKMTGWIMIDGSLCEEIIPIFLSHLIYIGNPAWIYDYSLDTRFIQWSVKQYFSWSQPQFTQLCKHMYYWFAVPCWSLPLSKSYLSSTMPSSFFHRAQSTVLIWWIAFNLSPKASEHFVKGNRNGIKPFKTVLFPTPLLSILL